MKTFFRLLVCALATLLTAQAQTIGISAPSGSVVTPTTVTGFYAGLTAASAPSITVQAVSSTGASSALTPVTVVPSGVAGSGSYAVTWPAAALGNYTINVVATAGTGAGAQTASASSAVTVTSVAPSVTIALSGGTQSIPIGSSRYITTPVLTDDGVIERVEFFLDGALIGTDTSAPFNLLFTAPEQTGGHQLTARAYDNAGNSTLSAPINIEVTTALGTLPTAGVLAPPSGAFTPVAVSVPITVTAADPDGTITSVQFFANGLLIPGTVSLVNGLWTLNWTPIAPGAVSLSAIATDDRGNAIATPAVGVTITDASAPSITLTATPGAAPATTLPTGSTRNIVAAVVPSPGRAIARVEFFVDGAKVGEDTTTPYTHRFTAPGTPGTHVLSARATDNAGIARDAQLAFSVTAAVGSPPTATLITPTNNTTVVPNTDLNLAGTAIASGGTITSVQFYANGSPVGPNNNGPVNTPPYATTFRPTAPGSYVFDMIATDDRGNSRVSNASTVTAAFGTPSVTITNPRADATNPGSSVRVTPNVPLTITATATGGTGATVLLVEFLIDGVQIGARTTPTTTGGTTYSFAWTPDTSLLGPHVLTARVTDTNSVSATSAPVNLNVATVTGTPPTVTIAAPANNAALQSLSTVNLIANSFATGGTIASVEFFLNDVSLGLAVREQATNAYRLAYDFSQVNYAGLTPNGAGQYPLTLYAIAKDSNGNQTVSATTNLLVTPSQSLPPSVTTRLLIGSVTAGTPFPVIVNVNDPDGTVTNLQLFTNGGTAAVVTQGNPTPGADLLLTFTPPTAGRFNVYAVVTDDTGNTAVSSPIVANVTGNTAPTAVLVRPTEDSTTTTVNTPVFLEATSTDPDAGQFVTVSFINTSNGATLAIGQRVGTSDVYRAIWTPAQANTFNVAVRAQDSANGQTTSSVVRRVVVANAAGLVPSATINVPNTTTTASTANFTATANDSDGSVIGVEFFINRNSVGQAVRDQQTNTWRLTASFAGVPPGAAEVVALVRDSAGNVAASPTSTVTVNAASSIAPSVTITPSTLNAAFNRQVQLTANARDTDGNVNNVQYFANATSIGNSGNSGTNFQVNWTPNQSGPFNIWAVATDNSGITTVSPTVVVSVRRNNPVLEDAAFILQTYQDIANTTNINPLVFADLDAQLGAGTLSRADLVMSLIDEPGFVAPVNLLAAYYVIMGHWPTPANYNTLLGTARNNFPNAIGNILSSNEYFAKYGVVPTVALLNNPASAIPAATFLNQLHHGAGLGAPSALDLVRFQNNNVASATIGRGYNSAGLNTAVAEFVTNTNSTNTALFNRARAAALYYQLNRPPVSVTTDQIAARVTALTQLPDTKAIAAAVLDDILYDHRYVTITKHPDSLTVAPRSGAIFRVEALGAPPLTYQWLLNGAPIPGATNQTLSLTNVDGTRVGAYTVVVTTSANTATSDPAALALSTTPTRLANISTRGVTTGGANVLIGGFVVQGTAPNQTRQMLIRVVGPGLAAQGVTGVLGNPRLEVYAGNNPTPTVSNDDWGTQTTGGAAAVTALQQATTRAGAFPLANSSNDAAVLATLAPGNYTVQAKGPNANSTGVVLIEVYDVTPGTAAGPKAVNVSTRGEVGTGNNLLIAGFVVNGGVSRRVLIRGVGPTLQNFGLPPSALLANPQITLVDQASGQTIKANDDWAGGDDAAVIAAAAVGIGAFPLGNGSRDAAMIVMLAPGAYTVQLSGVGNTTGIGIVEVYDVDP